MCIRDRVTLARIALRVFVGEDRTHRLHYGAGNEIFRGDQFKAGGLAADFIVKRFGDFGIGLIEMQAHALRFGCLIVSIRHFEPFMAWAMGRILAERG